MATKTKLESVLEAISNRGSQTDQELIKELKITRDLFYICKEHLRAKGVEFRDNRKKL